MDSGRKRYLMFGAKWSHPRFELEWTYVRMFVFVAQTQSATT